ncbi:MAG: energy transducer TonB [Nitrospirota bacterium]
MVSSYPAYPYDENHRGIEHIGRMFVISTICHVFLFSVILLYPLIYFREKVQRFQSYEVTLVDISPEKKEIKELKKKVTTTIPIEKKRAKKKVIAKKLEVSKVNKDRVIRKRNKKKEASLKDWWKKEIKMSAETMDAEVPVIPPLIEEVRPDEDSLTKTEAVIIPAESEVIDKRESSLPLTIPKANISLDITDFEFPYYLKRIESKISGMWSSPPLEGKAFTVTIGFTILRTGEVKDITIEHSSKNNYYDQSALRAVYLSNPLPPFPERLNKDFLKVHFNFVIEKRS